ncbi:hypothetical protein [Streptomyces sp. NPDC003943]
MHQRRAAAVSLAAVTLVSVGCTCAAAPPAHVADDPAGDEVEGD